MKKLGVGIIGTGWVSGDIYELLSLIPIPKLLR